MPFVNIQILKGHPQERKDEIARRVTDAISEVASFRRRRSGSCSRMSRPTTGMSAPRRVSEMKKQAARNEGHADDVEIRDPRFSPSSATR